MHHRPPPGAHHTLPTSIQLSLPPRGLDVAWKHGAAAGVCRHGAAAGVCRPRWACELGQSISPSVSDRDGEARVGGSVFAVRMRRLASGGKWRLLPGSGLGGADAASRRCKLRPGRRGCSSNFSGQGGADVVAGYLRFLVDSKAHLPDARSHRWTRHRPMAKILLGVIITIFRIKRCFLKEREFTVLHPTRMMDSLNTGMN
ncbi:uncharacterized protein [Miscanthus floridulus]|uniref:uncharacterized protein isoform X1 n=1 Tax=Miscanthus floridulus TaxID=154761 RepID=UPI003458F6DA